MITVELEYPLNIEVKEFDIPFPQIVVSREKYLAFLFFDEEELLNYLQILCDLSETVYDKTIGLKGTMHKSNCLKNLIAVIAK